MKKSIWTSLTKANVNKVLKILTETPSKLEALSKPLTGGQLKRPLRSGERSFIEVLAHLVNSEARSSESIYLALLVDEPLIADIHSERDWGKLVRFELLEFNDLLAYFNLRHKALMRVLSKMTESDWSRGIREKTKKRIDSIYWRARSLALHEAEHLAELEEQLAGKA